MNVGKPRILMSALVLITAGVTLSGCFLPRPGGGGSTPTPAPTSAAEAADTPSFGAEPTIIVLTEDEVVPIPVFIKSEPAGTWTVGPGVPPGFPAGVPVFTDRWIDNNEIEFEPGSGGYGYGAFFWGGYDHIDQLVLRLTEMGFEVTDQEDETKRVVIAETDRLKVIINGSETARNPGEEEFLDPAYTITVVIRD
jgi:hypothetical protein